MSTKLLLPYQNTRYHLNEWGSKRPQTREELFNLRHSSRRAGRVECAFGMWKSRFRILKNGIDGNLETVRLVTRSSAFLHNFLIRRFLEAHGQTVLEDTDVGHFLEHSQESGIFDKSTSDEAVEERTIDSITTHASTTDTPLHDLPASKRVSAAHNLRDDLATAAWIQYTEYLQATGRQAEPIDSELIMMCKRAGRGRKSTCADRFYSIGS